MLLFYLSMLKNLDRLLEKGKHDVHFFIFKTSVFTKHSAVFQPPSSRNILLCFKLHVLKPSTVCDPPHQFCGTFNFEFELTTLIRDLESFFNRFFLKILVLNQQFRVRNYPVSFIYVSFLCFGNCIFYTCNYFSSCVF